METQSLSLFLTSIVSGGGTFVSAKWILNEFDEWEHLGRKARFFSVIGICLAIVLAAYGLQIYLGYEQFSENNLFVSLAQAFTVSQLLWGTFEAGSKKSRDNADSGTGVTG